MTTTRYFMNKAEPLTFLQILVLWLCLLAWQSVTAAPDRVALIIGNQNYKNLPKLKNPANDATDISTQLEILGFNVDKLLDADHQQMKNAIRQFSNKLTNKNTVGLFYFAGHGVQVKNRNYLIPIGSDIQHEAEVPYHSIEVGQLLEYMEYAQNNLNLVILDACRNNPFGGRFRSAQRGLAKIDVVPKGSMILYAASPGQQAEDGDGRNGLFTEKLLQVMQKPGLTVDQLINKTAQAVNKASSSGQIPYKEGIILSDFYFTDQITINQAINQSNANTAIEKKVELDFWNKVKAEPSEEMYKAYLEQYPHGLYARIATIKLKKFDNSGHENSSEEIKTIKENEVLALIESYLNASNEQNLKNLLMLYAEITEYYGSGKVTNDFILKDKKNYFKRWPKIKYEFVKLDKNETLENGQKTFISFLFNFDVYNQSKNRGIKGVAKNNLMLENINGKLKIISEKQQIINKKNY